MFDIRFADREDPLISFLIADHRENAADAGCLQGLWRPILRETLRGLLLRRLFVFLQAVGASRRPIHLHRFARFLLFSYRSKFQPITKTRSRDSVPFFSAGTGACFVDKARRNWCPYCRLNKCFTVGMNTAGKHNRIDFDREREYADHCTTYGAGETRCKQSACREPLLDVWTRRHHYFYHDCVNSRSLDKENAGRSFLSFVQPFRKREDRAYETRSHPSRVISLVHRRRHRRRRHRHRHRHRHRRWYLFHRLWIQES